MPNEKPRRYTHDSPWFKLVNRIFVVLNRIGIAPAGHLYVLSIKGRKSGKMLSTPLAIVTMNGKKYVAALAEVNWVRNARAAGWGLLSKGRYKERVRLVELPVDEERREALREYSRQIPHGAEHFKRAHGISGDAESFAAIAAILPVFRMDPWPGSSRTAATT